MQNAHGLETICKKFRVSNLLVKCVTNMSLYMLQQRLAFKSSIVVELINITNETRR